MITAHGAIQRYEDLVDLIHEAKSDNVHILLHTVSNGARSSFWIIPSSIIVTEKGLFTQYIDTLTGGYLTSYEGIERMYDDSLCLHDFNVVDSRGELKSYNHNLIFTNSLHAENYVQQLRQDEQFQTDLKRHNDICDIVDRYIDEVFDDRDYDDFDDD